MGAITADERDTFIAEYMSGMGSSDSGTACGLNPFQTKLELYLVKRGITEAIDNRVLRLGRRMEPIIADEYTLETGVELVAPPVMRHRDHPWCIAHLDRITADGQKIVEIKAPGARMAKHFGEEGSDELPDYWISQCQHQMAVADLEVCDVAVLIGARDFKIMTVRRNEAFISAMIDMEYELWDRIQRADPPPPDYNHPRTGELLSKLYRVDSDAIVDLDDAAALDWEDYQTLGEEIRDLQAQREARRNALLDRLKHAAVGRLPHGLRELVRREIPGSTYTVNRKPSVRLLERQVRE